MSTEISTQTRPTGLALQSFDDAMRFGKMLADSDFAPKDFRGKAASCVLAVQHGAEIGFGPMQSIQCIAVINGRPSIWGDAALALVMASPVCEYVRETVTGEGEQMVATCEAKRRGYPQATTTTFSVADAKRAGLWGKTGPWTQYPRRMLSLRARGFALRDAFPDVLKGLVTAEEAQDYQHHEPVREPVVVRPRFDTEPAPAPQPREIAPGERATAADMERSRLAVNRARTVAEVEKMQSIVEQRLKAGFYTPSEADELLNLINGKLDILTSEPQAVSTEAAS